VATNIKKNFQPTILVANGVNLDMLGKREADIYGNFTLLDLEKFLKSEVQSAAKLAGLESFKMVFFQSNTEGEFLEKLSSASWDGIVINPGAWTHTSVALVDRLTAIAVPFVEVHISNIAAREEFRKNSFCAKHAAGVVYGFGLDSYLVGLIGLLKKINQKSRS
jgi:3-dehydroquinate dehydratase-2